MKPRAANRRLFRWMHMTGTVLPLRPEDEP